MYSGQERCLEQIKLIHAGDAQTREQFLAEYQPFVAKIAMSFCKRYLEWGRDDELSLGLIGLNHAIDHFQPDRNIPFLGYAQVVIQNKLKDYFKSQNKLSTESLWIETEEEEIYSPGEIKAAWNEFTNRTIEDERQSEIEELERRLAHYDIEFEDLVEAAPKHRDSRQTLIRAARTVLDAPHLVSYLQQKRQLPIKELVLLTSINRKTLERGRKYIIALVEILTNPQDFIYIRSYINLS